MNRYRRIRTIHRMDTGEREALLKRIDAITELPLLLLAFVMIPLLLGPLLWTLSPVEDAIFNTLDGFIWAIFAADLIVKLLISPNRLNYLRRHWLETLTVLVPFIRPLRIVRLLLFGSRAFLGARRLVNVDFLLVYGIGMVIISATVVTAVEQGQNSIESFPDALWWAVVTVTTVGYGDMTPVTITGRAVATVLMFVGIGLFGGLTANLASAIVRSRDSVEEKVDDIAEDLRLLRDQVTAGQQMVAARQEPASPSPSMMPTVPGQTEHHRRFSLHGASNIIREQLGRILPWNKPSKEQISIEAKPRGENMPDIQTFREAWGKFATGVSIVTTVRADGEVHGMTANGINSVSLDPLLVLVCAGHSTTSYPMIKEARRFAINILSEDQRAVAEYYARPTDQKTGELDANFSRTERGAAVLDGSLARMDCRVVTEHIAGDHTIFIGEVEEIEVGSGRPLLYFEGRFNELGGS